jgi:hypothetical protein
MKYRTNSFGDTMGAGMKGKPGNVNHPGFTETIKINT